MVTEVTEHAVVCERTQPHDVQPICNKQATPPDDLDNTATESLRKGRLSRGCTLMLVL